MFSTRNLFFASLLASCGVSAISSPIHAQVQSISTQPGGASLIVTEDPQAGGLNLYRFNNNGTTTLLHENIFPDQTTSTFDAHFVDEATGKVYLKEDTDSNPNFAGQNITRYRIYDAVTNKFEGYTTVEGLPEGGSGNPTFVKVPFGIKDVVNKLCDSKNGETCIDDSNVISLGGSGTEALATIDEEGLSVGGKSIVRREINAEGEEELHIGENSLVTVESDGVQKLYATDANGKKIPINITDGSDLQINGVSVQGQLDTNAGNIIENRMLIDDNAKAIDTLKDNVNDLGFGVAGATALSTAMSALPTVAQDSPVSCGVGTGGYSSRFAMSVGCAVKANDRLSINAGGSYVFGGAADYGNGSLSSAAARAGFVFKFGKLDTPVASNEQLQSQLDEVQEENASIKEQNQELLARLERLEAIALGNKSSETTASLK